MTHLQTRGSTPFLVSSRPMVTGSVALLEPVPKAVVKAEVMFARNLKGRLRVASVNSAGSTRNPWIQSPMITVLEYFLVNIFIYTVLFFSNIHFLNNFLISNI